MAKSIEISSPCSRAARDQPAEILECAKRGMQRVVPALGSADGIGLPTSVGPGVRVLLRPLRALRPIGWIGGKQRTSKPMSRTRGRCAITSSKVPWRAGSSVIERGNSSYQAAKPAASRSTSSASGSCRDRERALAGIGDDLARLGRDQRLHAGGDVAVLQDRQGIGQRGARAGSWATATSACSHFGQLDRDVDAGVLLQPDGAAERGVFPSSHGLDWA